MSIVAETASAADENLAVHFTWVQRQTARMRASLEEDLVRGLRDLVGPDAIHYIRAN